MLNRELAEFTLEFIENREDVQHNQDVWFDGTIDTPITGRALASNEAAICGTQGCYAGWASLFAGYFQVAEFNAEVNRYFGTDSVVDPSTGDELYMQHAAMKALGITKLQAGKLFYNENNADELRKLVNMLLENENANLWEADEHYQVYLAKYGKEVADAYALKTSDALLGTIREQDESNRVFYELWMKADK